MAIAQSKITAQGQISVPAEVRKKLGVGPGSTIEWDEGEGQVIVRRAGRYTSLDVHRAIFGETRAAGQKPISAKEGVQKYIRKRHARR